VFIGGDPEGVGEAASLAEVVPPRDAEATVAADMNRDVGARLLKVKTYFCKCSTHRSRLADRIGETNDISRFMLWIAWKLAAVI